METIETIFIANEFGCAFKIGRNGELFSTPMYKDNTFNNDDEDWNEVTDFYPKEVKAVNKVFKTNFKQNIN